MDGVSFEGDMILFRGNKVNKLLKFIASMLICRVDAYKIVRQQPSHGWSLIQRGYGFILRTNLSYTSGQLGKLRNMCNS
jgi:hypothetical protein